MDAHEAVVLLAQLGEIQLFRRHKDHHAVGGFFVQIEQRGECEDEVCGNTDVRRPDVRLQ
ncbi:MAG: hypothetical protein PHS73_03910 [Candidatus Peribacteraceae bacterium]|nr:hypothetical protein [Candidatus Peribacteraceae bacterium]